MGALEGVAGLAATEGALRGAGPYRPRGVPGLGDADLVAFDALHGHLSPKIVESGLHFYRLGG